MLTLSAFWSEKSEREGRGKLDIILRCHHRNDLRVMMGSIVSHFGHGRAESFVVVFSRVCLSVSVSVCLYLCVCVAARLFIQLMFVPNETVKRFLIVLCSPSAPHPHSHPHQHSSLSRCVSNRRSRSVTPTFTPTPPSHSSLPFPVVVVQVSNRRSPFPPPSLPQLHRPNPLSLS